MSMLIDIIMRLLLLLISLLAAAVPARGATITRVIDGDTVIVNDSQRVRLYGIDCPERGQSGGLEAAEAVARLVSGQCVRLEVLYTDRYRRTVALIILESGITVQEELIREGMAWVAPRYCTRPECAAWRDLEREARLWEIGIWQDAQVVPPWEWRRQRRAGRR